MRSNKDFPKFLLGIVLFFPTSNVLYSQNETAVTALTFPVGARSNAMGGAHTAVGTDPLISFYNPAGLSSFTKGSFGLFRSEWLGLGDNTWPMIYMATAYHTVIGTFGLSFHRFSANELKVVQPEGSIVEGDAYDQSISFSYAARIDEHLSLGGSIRYLESDFVEGEARAWSLDLGVLVNSIFPQTTLSFDMPQLRFLEKFDHPEPRGFSLGVSIQNMGPDKIEYLNDDQSAPLPQILRLGFAYRPVLTHAVEILLVSDLEKLLVRRHPDGSFDSFAKAFLTSWNDGVDAFRFGAEINLLHLFALRFGRDFSYQRNIEGKTVSEWTVGFGLGPEWAQISFVRRGFPSFSDARWAWLDVSVMY